jgi:tRNA pseudouridine55 synthase
VTEPRLKKDINGVLLLNKPLHLSSNQALQKAKRLFQAKKAGHTGSLDPLATGMLPLCFGEATKFSQFLLDANKCYEVTGILGVKTATSDSEGEVIAFKDPAHITLEQLKETLDNFLGEQTQVPSMYSALKHKGQPLYKLAREGVEVERKARFITIHSIELLDVDFPAFSLRVVCSKGTYIRNLVEDIGEALGVGAHVSRLHRAYSEPYQEKPLYTLDELHELSDIHALLLPIDSMLGTLPRITLSDDEISALFQGKKLSKECACPSTFTLYNEEGHFKGLVESINKGQLKSKRLLKQNQP